MKKESSFIKKIYLMCYSSPRYKAEIKNILYNEEKPTVDKWIKTMLSNGTEHQVSICKKQQIMGNKFSFTSEEFNGTWEKILPDGRSHDSLHYIAKARPILDYLLMEFKDSETTYSLTDEEQKKVLSILRHQSFRKTIEVSDYLQDIDPMDHIIFTLANAAGVMFSLKEKYNEGTIKNMFNILASGKEFDKKAKSKQIINKTKKIQESLELVNMPYDKMLKRKESALLFLNIDKTLLKKLMSINFIATYSAALIKAVSSF